MPSNVCNHCSYPRVPPILSVTPIPMAALTSYIASGVSYAFIRFIQEQNSDDEDEFSSTTVILPKWINPRWGKFVKRPYPLRLYQYGISPALKSANVSRKEFLKCWRFVRSRAAPDDVFSWLKDAGFGQGSIAKSRHRSLRVAFVRKILQQYKDMKVSRVHMFLLFFVFFFVATICFSCLCTLMRNCTHQRAFFYSNVELLFPTCTYHYSCIQPDPPSAHSIMITLHMRSY